MARGDKQTNREDKYSLKIEAMKLNAEERLKWIEEYSKEIEANKNKKKGSAEDGSGAATGEATFSGPLPTIADYKGPNKSATTRPSGGSYRTSVHEAIKGSDKWNDKIVGWAKQHNLHPMLMKLIMAIESGGDKDLRERGGNGVGLFQITPPNIDTPCDTGRLTDADYNAEIFGKVIHNEKVKYFKVKTCKETAEKYNGGGAWARSYANMFEEMMKGFGFDANAPLTYVAVEGKSGAQTGGGGSFNTSFPGGVQGATIVNGKVNAPPAQNRGDYRTKILAARKGYTGHQRLDASRFVSNLGGCTMMEAPEFIPFVELLYNTMKAQNLLTNGKMLVNSAYRPGDNDFHGCGMAIDIGVEGRSRARAYQIADMAYNLGFRAVQPGGGFVHIDIGPPGSWGDYPGYPPYKGPGSGP